MDRQIICDCGFALRSPAPDELVRIAQAHALESHGLVISAELALAMSRPVQAESGGTR
jgi:hypothetical protein